MAPWLVPRSSWPLTCGWIRYLDYDRREPGSSGSSQKWVFVPQPSPAQRTLPSRRRRMEIVAFQGPVCWICHVGPLILEK
ncbi:hypothetical protein M406DRAFT_324270 [Cryphonectria parasitica EP155]|uniref:Uncharacterized protein n=1 Tax=Cryphonectria parasitica (strain ATCC 38755 / EP155) TaxID=660469 RepID=A0A9P5CLC7_CRYP1|nr:uncharacterized protein M406DRAFT_324270 [Cryphonectria parasitica EP155]KAF3761886.1 hypothetical protein M406DRAFT_324270 [Cryphonectria parasitica EP155]